ncbi:hypothetical protein CSUI_007690, partial [Cystoisospora suis]
ANCAAVREWDSNGTVFGYNRHLKAHQAGEFGHNDFYPVVIAAIQAMACHTNSSSGDDLDGRYSTNRKKRKNEMEGIAWPPSHLSIYVETVYLSL